MSQCPFSGSTSEAPPCTCCAPTLPTSMRALHAAYHSASSHSGGAWSVARVSLSAELRRAAAPLSRHRDPLTLAAADGNIHVQPSRGTVSSWIGRQIDCRPGQGPNTATLHATMTS
eukprot:353887-Chlamydomonas_euryale.AAC.5